MLVALSLVTPHLLRKLQLHPLPLLSPTHRAPTTQVVDTTAPTEATLFKVAIPTNQAMAANQAMVVATVVTTVAMVATMMATTHATETNLVTAASQEADMAVNKAMVAMVANKAMVGNQVTVAANIADTDSVTFS